MKPTAILCADLHFRDDQPICRTDDFFETQIRKMRWLRELAHEQDCPVICSGDYFHHWKPSPQLLSACIAYMPFVITIPGNHDLPQHNINLIEKSGLWTLEKAGKVAITQIKLGEIAMVQYEECPKIGVIHKLINHPQSTTTAKNILKKYPEYNLILSGDNHQTFEASIGNRWLINPGSFSRQTADQINHKPCVYLWYSAEMHFDAVEVPIINVVISTKHLKEKKEKDLRIDKFTERLKEGYNISASFKENMKAYFENNMTRKGVKEMVYELMEG